MQEPSKEEVMNPNAPLTQADVDAMDSTMQPLDWSKVELKIAALLTEEQKRALLKSLGEDQ